MFALSHNSRPSARGHYNGHCPTSCPHLQPPGHNQALPALSDPGPSPSRGQFHTQLLSSKHHLCSWCFLSSESCHPLLREPALPATPDGASGFSATQAFASTNIIDSWDSLMAFEIPLLPAPHFYIPLAALAGF